MRAAGRVEALFIAPEAGAPVRSVPSVATDGRRGLEGDRYALGAGHWSDGRWEPVTLISVEALEAVARILGREVDPWTPRRNVVTRGVDLEALVGRTFRIGGTRLEGCRPCDPCRYLEDCAGLPGLRSALKGRGGLRATLLTEGVLRVGDPVVRETTRDLVDSRDAGA